MNAKVDVWALMGAAIGVVALVRMVRTGSASASGTAFMRDEEPAIYWSVFVAGILIVVALGYAAFFIPPV